ncbi:MAG: DUF4249 domain-containing protein [Flavobacteriales bacterium]|nr:DUF4249 domain-containing protein [Flavobacteriales bacterium]
MKKYLFFISIILLSCQEEITLNIPQAQDKIVVEGSIENGFPTYVTLRKNQGYFESIDSITISKLYITDATVSVTREDGEKRNLTLITQSEIDILESLIGYSVNIPPNIIYIDLEELTSPGFSIANRSYTLDIVWNDQSITAETTIPEVTPLDCLWVEKSENEDKEFKYDIRALYSDPADQNNNILVKSKRVQHYEINREDTSSCETINYPDFSLKLIDAGSDILINGQTFETYFPRPKDNGFPTGNYNAYHTKICDGDTLEFKEDIVLIKFCQIDEPSLKFWRGLIRQVGTNGNPFAEPINLVSNINNGLGVFTGYGSVYYKVPIIKDIVIKNQYDSLSVLDIF